MSNKILSSIKKLLNPPVALSRLKYPFLAGAASLAPNIALADETLKLAGNNAWPIYVYGNPRVVYDILTSAALFINPQFGDSGFRYALYTLSLVGFLILAVRAGYDPGKNFIKMFTYIIFVWVVTIFTFNISVNADVIDVLNADGNNSYIVQNAPALAVVPMSFMFKVGRYIDDKTQTIYTIPDTFKSNTPGVGTFNLFGKMVEAADRFTLQNTYLKQSISNYTTDCVVPALATNRVYANLPDGSVLRGTEALKHTTNYWATLETAKHASIFTKYYPNLNNPSWTADLPASISSSFTPSDPNISPAAGLITTCSAAFEAMSGDLDREAESLKTLAAKQFSATGTTTLFEGIFNEMLVAASTANVTPASAIKQRALLAQSGESFRSAAVSVGNNEVMQNLAVAQAEVQQKSTWAAAFATFNNMMGYVYVVLQAFIFAITPIIVLALVVPGMGTKIVGNYMQIMLWLALWPPMLGIINYVITLFGIDAVKGAYSLGQGYATLSNTSLISERTANLTLAAQFLGTMIPMISWGIIKGAMAFTEFISAGVGSQFASQAGAQAATGNFSLNQGSMNNLTLDKMSTTASASVGFDAIRGMNAASASQITTAAGGSNYSVAGKDVDLSRSLQQASSAAETYQKTVSSSVSQALNNAKSWGQAVDHVKSTTSGAQRVAALQALAQIATAATGSQSLGDAVAKGDSASVNYQTEAHKGTETTAGVRGEAKTPSALPVGAAANAGYNAKAGTSQATQVSNGQNTSTTNTGGNSQAITGTAGTGLAGSTGDTQAAGTDNGRRINASTSWNQQESLSKARQIAEARSQQLQATLTEARSLNMATNMDAVRAQALISQLNTLTQGQLQSMDQLAQGRTAAANEAQTAIDKTTAATGDPQHNGAGRPAEAQRIKAEADAAAAEAQRGASAVRGDTAERVAGLKDKAKGMADTTAGNVRNGQNNLARDAGTVNERGSAVRAAADTALTHNGAADDAARLATNGTAAHESVKAGQRGPADRALDAVSGLLPDIPNKENKP